MNDIPELRLRIDQVALKLAGIHYRRLSADGLIKMPPADLYRLLLVTSGEGRLTIDGRIVPVRRGSCCLLPPGAYNAASLSGGEGLICYDLTFAAARFEAGLTGTGSETGRHGGCSCQVIPDRHLVQAAELAKRLYMERETTDALEQFRLNAIFQELMYWALRELGTRQTGSAKEAIEGITDYIERHSQEKLTRDMLAEKAGMSREYFSRMFRKETGQTLAEYVTAVRINRAKRELLRRRSSISAIAEEVGFEEQYYFNRKFKQQVGMTPTAYMQKRQTRVACLFGPYVDHLLTLETMPASVMIDKAHPLAERVPSSAHLGDEEAGWNERCRTLLERMSPDLILCSSYIDPRLELALNRIAPTVPVAFKQDWRQALREIALVLDKAALAEQAIRQYEAKCAAIAKRLKRTLGGEAVALLRVHADQLRLYGGSRLSYTGPVLYGDLKLNAPRLVRKLAWGQACVPIEPQTLAQLDAERLLLVIDPGCEAKADALLQSDVWGGLPAVRSGRVYEADYYTWMSTGSMMNHRKLDEALRLLGNDA